MKKEEKIRSILVSLGIGGFFSSICYFSKAPIWLTLIVLIVASGITFLLMLGLLATGEPYEEKDSTDLRDPKVRSWYYLSRSKEL
ncbi:TPA: hypothetical protein DIC38_01500 [Candidatus Nomurabacteria bacterium]|nr:MAG: hypothetical protein O210_OD1C00001G0433 [Parcubacteria bacterium RAAC4_OD1_1]HCY26336.1 hypothetical protein [Candidatus Nomurabacteria bacterium]